MIFLINPAIKYRYFFWGQHSQTAPTPARGESAASAMASPFEPAAFFPEKNFLSAKKHMDKIDKMCYNNYNKRLQTV